MQVLGLGITSPLDRLFARFGGSRESTELDWSFFVQFNKLGPEDARVIGLALRDGAMGSLNSIKLDKAILPVKQLTGTDPDKSLDLLSSWQSGGLNRLDAIVIAKCIELNGSLKVVRSAASAHKRPSDLTACCVTHS